MTVDPKAALFTAAKALLARHAIELQTLDDTGQRGVLQATGQRWVTISIPGYADLNDIQVAMPFRGELQPDSAGQLGCRTDLAPAPTDLEEIRQFVASLAAQGQIAQIKTKAGVAASHAIESGSDGRRRLVRKRFNARG